MNFISKLTVLASTLFILSTQCGEITIRLATLKDCDALAQLSHKQYQNDFKPLWIKHYAALTPEHQTIEEFVDTKTTINNTANCDFIKKQENQENYRLLIAKITSLDSPSTIADFCRFNKKDEHTLYINFISVDQQFRKQGIAKKLALAAMNTFKGITICNFTALRYNDFINDIYSEHGCVKSGTIALDPTGKISTDPDAPITHYNYSYAIQK